MSDRPRHSILTTIVLPALALFPSLAVAVLVLSSVTAGRPVAEFVGELLATPVLVWLPVGAYVGGWAIVGLCHVWAGRQWYQNCGRGTDIRPLQRREAPVEARVRPRKARRQPVEDGAVRDTMRSLFAGVVTLVALTLTMWGC